MNQGTLFHESLSDALRTAVMALGGFKRVGAELWPSLPIERAARDLADCLTDGNPRKLDLDQIEFIVKRARRVGCHAPMHYLAVMADYEEPSPRDPESEVQRLQREFITAQQQLVKLAERIEAKTADIGRAR